MNELWAPKGPEEYQVYAYMSPAGVPYFQVQDKNGARIGGAYHTQAEAEDKIEKLLKRGV